jgi:eukaryotic-like serine/threonine-protein kinase
MLNFAHPDTLFREVRMPKHDEPPKDLSPKPTDLPGLPEALPTVDADATLDFAAATPSSTSARAQDFRSIGPYRLLEKIGEGGMGQVWLAEQTAPVQRRVALKLIRAGMYDDALLRRFQSERQSLAMMDHPSIAKVFDAGATLDGQPYFVMEYVPGETITHYCDHKKLKIRERLELFIKACEGVQHAHQKAIIHRDLKPANILVVEVDGKPTPRIIDFGLAKALSAPIDGEVFVTRVGGFVGTPGFMSPEQSDPGILDVDTRTDVYALGVILYVLLTGMLPFDMQQWKTRPFDEILRQLREEDAPSPSAKLAVEKDSAIGAAERRGTQPRQLVKSLHGDLDWITMKAVEKDRARRYGTPSELAADIRRYLNHEPVIARPASAGYRLQKYVRRHRIAVSVAAMLVLLLAGFAAVQAAELRRITRERDRANRVTDFVTGMFKVSDPSEARGNSITAREILDKASSDIDTSLQKDPDLQAQMMDVMGRVYDNLGLYPHAQSLLQGAVDTREKILGPNNSETLTSLDNLANTLADEGRYTEAEKYERQILDIRQRMLGPKNPDTLGSMNNLAATFVEEGKFQDAEKLDRETLDLRRRVLGPDNPATLTSMYNLGWILQQEGRYADAEILDRQTLDARRRVLGPDHPQTLASMGNVAIDLLREGKYSDAEALDRETVAGRQRVLGPDHRETLMAMTNLANDFRSQRKYADAEALSRQTLDIERRTLGPEHPTTISTMTNLGIILQEENRIPEAEKMDRETLDLDRRVLGPEYPGTLNTTSNLAIVLKLENHFTDAEKLYRENLAVEQRVDGAEHPFTLATMINLGNCLVSEGRYDEAEKLFSQTLEIERRVLRPNHPYTTATYLGLAEALAHEGKPDESLSALRDSIAGEVDPDTYHDIETDPDLKSLHGDPRFAAIVADARQRGAQQQKAN